MKKILDRCQILRNNTNGIAALSSVTLLEMGERCTEHGNDDNSSFIEFHKLIIKSDNELQQCLDVYNNQVCLYYYCNSFYFN